MADANGGRDRKADPLAQLQQFLTDWERRVDGLANRVMGTDEFSRSMNGLQNLQLGMQKAFLEAMATHLNNLNMPSRADVTAIGETLLVLEKRMARMEAMLAQLVHMQPSALADAGSDAPSVSGPGPGNPAAPPRRPGPPRTRQPPSRRGAAADASGGAAAPPERAGGPTSPAQAADASPAQDPAAPGQRYGGSTA